MEQMDIARGFADGCRTMGEGLDGMLPAIRRTIEDYRRDPAAHDASSRAVLQAARIIATVLRSLQGRMEHFLPLYIAAADELERELAGDN